MVIGSYSRELGVWEKGMVTWKVVPGARVSPRLPVNSLRIRAAVISA